MKKINLFLNSTEITASPDKTILEIAKDNNIIIPTLCKDPRLEPITSCFLCVVEIEGLNKLVPACSTFPREGMKISTNSDRIISARKTALELILSNHYGDCIAPCKLACPAGCDVQGYVGLIANGKYDEALKLIKETIPLPAAIGRVCPRFCEDKCRRQNIDEPIAIDYLKRYVADLDLTKENPYMPDIAPKIGKKVAVIGGGPAGLSSAYYLAQQGVDVEIFEKNKKLGGMIYYGVPDYRLPKEITEKEVAAIIDLGIKVHPEKCLGKNLTIDDLINEKFNAVILSPGAWTTRKMNIPGENLEQVHDSLHYLEKVNKNETINLHGRVAVIGGGNTAFDCARSALRIGADEVRMIYRRTIKEMPANNIEKIEAKEEGIIFDYLTIPVKIDINSNNKLIITLQKMELGEADSSGRRRPVPIDGSEYDEVFDFAITAIGQLPDYDILGNYKKKLLEDSRWIKYNENSGQSLINNIFTAGDFASGAKTVVEAIAGGRKAADSIIKLFNNETLENQKEFLSYRENLSELSEDFYSRWDKKKREKPEILKPEIRKNTFEEIEDVFTENQALAEASRCMECGCMDLYQCELKKYAGEYSVEENIFNGDINKYNEDNSHPYIFREPDKCILCGRCVSLCKEKINIGVYGYINRGFETIVGCSFNNDLNYTDCISCGTCISGCPVGALVPKNPDNKKIPLKGHKIESFCFHCSIGCENYFEVLKNNIYEMHEKNDYLCKKGKFNFPSLLPEKTDYESLKELKEIKNAVIYPSPSLSCEEYETIKTIAGQMNWTLKNYYSGSSLWQAFAELGFLPQMDFFNRSILPESLIIIAGDLENTNPIAINHLNNNITDGCEIILLNNDIGKRLYNLKSRHIINIVDLNKIELIKYSEIVLLIDPINFDKKYGNDASLKLYNNIHEVSKKIRTTLFSESRNLYSFYDADKNTQINNREIEIYIKTIPMKKSKKYYYIDAVKNNQNCEIGYSFQIEGSYLNSKNKLYKNKPVLNNNIKSLSEILNYIFDIKCKIKIKNIKNILNEKKINISKNKILQNFPIDSLINSYKQ